MMANTHQSELHDTIVMDFPPCYRQINKRMYEGFLAHRNDPDNCYTHFLLDRYVSVYIDQKSLPVLGRVANFALKRAATILDVSISFKI